MKPKHRVKFVDDTGRFFINVYADSLVVTDEGTVIADEVIIDIPFATAVEEESHETP